MTMHPLSRPAAWSLNVGASSVPAIKWAGGALWASAALMALNWLAGLIQDAFVGQLPAWIGAAATLAVIAWFVMTWQVIRRWFGQSVDLTLSWQGPVLAANPTQRGQQVAQGGFHVVEWQSAAQVKVVLDWQRWMLLRIRSLNKGHENRSVYCWLDMAVSPHRMRSPDSATLHQLRSLLYLPPSWIAHAEDQPASLAGHVSHRTKAVASWAVPITSGTLLPRTVPASTMVRPSSSDRREVDTLFPLTELLDDACWPGSDDRASKELA